MRIARAASVAALAFTTTFGTAAVAGADAPHHHDSVVDIKLTTTGIQAPLTHEGGVVSFNVTTDDPNGRQLQIIRPHDGVSIDQVLHDLAPAVGNDPAAAALAIRTVRDEAEALGGALATPAVPMHFAEPISPGAVYLIDFTSFLNDPATVLPVKTLQICGEDKDAELPRFPHGIVIQQETAAGPRFQTEDVDRADGSYLVHNSADELHEMQIQPVAPGTTDAQVQAFFDSILSGNPTPPPFTGPPVGLGVISPDHSAIVHAEHLPPGTYVLLCFVPDDQTGLPHAFEGMHKVVQLS